MGEVGKETGQGGVPILECGDPAVANAGKGFHLALEATPPSSQLDHTCPILTIQNTHLLDFGHFPSNISQRPKPEKGPQQPLQIPTALTIQMRTLRAGGRHMTGANQPSQVTPKPRHKRPAGSVSLLSCCLPNRMILPNLAKGTHHSQAAPSAV